MGSYDFVLWIESVPLLIFLYLRFMSKLHTILVLLIGILPVVLDAQKPIDLKNKYLGYYEGTIPSFKMDSGEDLITVKETPIKVVISEEKVTIEIGQNKISGSYTVLFKGDGYWVLDCRMEDQLAGERIVVFKRGKTITREGLYPQPNAMLEKTGKL